MLRRRSIPESSGLRCLAVAAFACLSALALSGRVRAADPATSVGLSLGIGHDSNPLRLSEAGADGYYTELALTGGVNLRLDPRLNWFVYGGAQARDHESDLSDADVTTADLRVGFEISPNPWAYRKVLIAVGGLYGVGRSTFIDRATGHVYEVESDPPTDPPTPVPIPDRFDADSVGAFVDVGWNLGGRLRLFLNTLLERVDYVEDYNATTALHPLDYEALTVEPGLFVRLNRMVGLRVAVGITELEYDDHPALDEDGLEVPGSTRRYDYTDFRLSLRVAPSTRWSLEAGVRGGERVDAFAGYYDFDSRVSYLSLDHRPGRRTRLQLYASSRDLDYDRAVVPGSADGELRASDVKRLVGRFDWHLGKGLGLFGEGGTQRVDNADPIYAYDRDWVLTGITFRR